MGLRARRGSRAPAGPRAPRSAKDSRVGHGYFRSRWGEPAPVYVWDPTTGRELTTYRGHQVAAEDPRLAWSPDGRGRATSWELSTQVEGPTSWSPDRRRFAAIPYGGDAVLAWEMP